MYLIRTYCRDTKKPPLGGGGGLGPPPGCTHSTHPSPTGSPGIPTVYSCGKKPPCHSADRPKATHPGVRVHALAACWAHVREGVSRGSPCRGARKGAEQLLGDSPCTGQDALRMRACWTPARPSCRLYPGICGGGGGVGGGAVSLKVTCAYE